MEDQKRYQVIEKKDGSVKIKITIPNEPFKTSYEKLLDNKIAKAELKGFRKGKAPRNIVESLYMNDLLIEAFEKIAPLYVQMAAISEKVEPIAPAEYTELPKLSLDNDLEFEITLTTMPEFKLGDLKKIKIEKSDTKAQDKEIDDALGRLKDQSQTKEKEINEKWAEEVIEMYKLENVKGLEGLRKYIAENIETQKRNIVLRTNESEVVKQAVKLSNIDIPEKAVKFEAAQREQAFLNDLKKIGTPLEVFLERQGITIEDLRTRWEMDSREALENDVLFKLYAADRKIEVTDEDLEKEIENIKKSDQNAQVNPAYNDENWRSYIKSFILKQKAFNQLLGEFIPDYKHSSFNDDHSHDGHDHSHSDHDHNNEQEDSKSKKKESKAKKSK